jgi:hypothetical protein
MSGGGGGGDDDERFAPTKTKVKGSVPGGSDRCSINIRIPLSATIPANIAKIKLSEFLNIAVRNFRGTDTIVATVPRDNSVVGAVAYRDVNEFIECISEGFEYEAKVISLSETSVKVHITRK